MVSNLGSDLNGGFSFFGCVLAGLSTCLCQDQAHRHGQTSWSTRKKKSFIPSIPGTESSRATKLCREGVGGKRVLIEFAHDTFHLLHINHLVHRKQRMLKEFAKLGWLMIRAESALRV